MGLLRKKIGSDGQNMASLGTFLKIKFPTVWNLFSYTFQIREDAFKVFTTVYHRIG